MGLDLCNSAIQFFHWFQWLKNSIETFASFDVAIVMGTFNRLCFRFYFRASTHDCLLNFFVQVKKIYFPLFVLYFPLTIFSVARKQKKRFSNIVSLRLFDFFGKKTVRKMKSQAYFHFVKRCKWHESPQNTRFYAVQNSMGFLMLFSVWIIFIIYFKRGNSNRNKNHHTAVHFENRVKWLLILLWNR